MLLASILPMESMAQKSISPPLDYTVTVISTSETSTTLEIQLEGSLPEGQFIFSGKKSELNSSLGPQLKLKPLTACIETHEFIELGTNTQEEMGRIKGWKLQGEVQLKQQITLRKKCIYAGIESRFIYNWYDGKYLRSVILYLDVPDFAFLGMQMER